jgi:hypothetical protein
MPLLEKPAVGRVLVDEQAHVSAGEVVVELVFAHDLEVAGGDVPPYLLPQSLHPRALPAAQELLLGELDQVLEDLRVGGVERLEAFTDRVTHSRGRWKVSTTGAIFADNHLPQNVFCFPAMHTLQYSFLLGSR